MAVEVKNVEKSYGNLCALKDITFDVPYGEMFGIIGPDGAGKTTLFRILTTLILADKGNARVAGYDVVDDYKEIRKRIGYMPGRFSLYQDMTVEENLDFFASVFRTTVAANYDLIRDIYIQIEPFKKRRAGALSGGMKQKLALCCALIHKPEVLFLDEPTTGVDPVSRKEFWDILDRLKTQGIAILVSTPYMDEASRCDRIALMNDGEFLMVDTPQGIIESYDKTIWSVEASNMTKLLKILREIPDIETAFAFGDVHHITVNPSFTVETLRDFLVQKGFENVIVKNIEPNIEDVYMLLAKI